MITLDEFQSAAINGDIDNLPCADMKVVVHPHNVGPARYEVVGLTEEEMLAVVKGANW
jgi:hypothetical protein